MAIRVALVEDEEEVRKLTAAILNFYPDLECVGSYASAEGLTATIDTIRPGVVLMDIGLPKGQNGIECVRQLKPLYPGIQFVMLTGMNNPEMTFEALKVGATGYILKMATPEKLADAIRDVAVGGSPMSSTIARLVAESFQKIEPTQRYQTKLTKTELEILKNLDDGFSYKEIAARRFIDISTVQSHIRHVYEKLQVHSRTEAVNKAYGRK